MSKSPNKDDDGLIYIDELASIINREVGTIRKWHRTGKLPKRLEPKRGRRGWRCWTPAQVEGIKRWMTKNDMRPGRLYTDPAKESEHVEHLRKPKFMNGHQIRSARDMARNGRSLEYILKKIHPRTKYASPENLEVALRKVAEREGWNLPRSKR